MGQDATLAGLEALEPHECLERLASTRVGRVGFVTAGQPRVLPVNFGADGDGSVVIRVLATSMLAKVVGQPVAFEIDGFDEARRTGWSVCVHGVACDVTDDVAAEGLRREPDVVTWLPGRDRWLMITPDEITGRRIPLTVSPADFGWIPGVVS